MIYKYVIFVKKKRIIQKLENSKEVSDQQQELFAHAVERLVFRLDLKGGGLSARYELYRQLEFCLPGLELRA
jgi:hypothetical protein